MALRPLTLDFATPPARRGLLGVVVLAAGVAVAAAVGAQLSAIEGERSALEARRASAEKSARRSGPAVARDAQSEKASADELARVSGVLDRIGVPWDAFFSELEAAANDEVALVNVQPDTAGRQVRIGGEAKNFAALVAYVKRLEARDALADVHLASHELKGAGQSVGFVINARWVRPS